MNKLICPLCKKEKLRDKFPTWKRTFKKHKSKCKNCIRNLSVKKCRNNNLEKYKQKNTEFRFNNPIKTLLYAAKSRAKKKNLLFNLKTYDIIIPEFCPVLNIKLEKSKNCQSDNSPTLDRIDSNKGYIKENVKVISWKANAIKNFGTIEDHEKVIKYMQENGCK